MSTLLTRHTCSWLRGRIEETNEEKRMKKNRRSCLWSQMYLSDAVEGKVKRPRKYSSKESMQSYYHYESGINDASSIIYSTNWALVNVYSSTYRQVTQRSTNTTHLAILSWRLSVDLAASKKKWHEAPQFRVSAWIFSVSFILSSKCPVMNSHRSSTHTKHWWY